MEEKNKKFLNKLIFFFVALIIVVCSILLYSRYIGTSGLKVKEYKIVNENLSNDFYGLKIVHISDIHYGRLIFKDDLKKIVHKINILKPDILVLTGDLIDKDTTLTESMANEISEELSKINSTIGKYAIKGEHDYNFDKWQFIIENSEFIDLNDRYELIYANSKDYILLSGMSTNIYGDKKTDEKEKIITDYLNNNENKPNYSILLIHEGDFIDEINTSNYNLILAGHSHNGQIKLPFLKPIKLPKYGKKYYDEYYKKNTTDIYISSGIGVSDSNFRLFNRPSINLYRLTKR